MLAQSIPLAAQSWRAEVVGPEDAVPPPAQKPGRPGKVTGKPAQKPAPASREAEPSSSQPAGPAAQNTVAGARAADEVGAADAELADPFGTRMPRTTEERQLGPEGPTGAAQPSPPAPAQPPQAQNVEPAPVDRTPAAQYCNNIVDAAIDARIAWQRQNLAEAEKQIAARTAELEAKTAEYQRWLARRDEFAEKARKTVVDIYTKMKPDAAAAQIAQLDEETAAAVMIKLDPRAASAVMNEMDPQIAARITSIISGSAKGPNPRLRRPAPPGNRS
jgi:flagellar motility protein MotE (MotC chaperone)